MPKPVARGVGPEVSLPIRVGPSVGGEALRPVVRERIAEEPRFEPREPERVFERRVEEPRFEPREPERVFERRVEEPRFEPRAEPRFEPRESPVVEDHIE